LTVIESTVVFLHGRFWCMEGRRKVTAPAAEPCAEVLSNWIVLISCGGIGHHLYMAHSLAVFWHALPTTGPAYESMVLGIALILRCRFACSAGPSPGGLMIALWFRLARVYKGSGDMIHQADNFGWRVGTAV